MTSPAADTHRKTLRYRRQWVVRSNALPLFEGWGALQLTRGFSLSYHPDTSIKHFAFPNGGIIVVGLAVLLDGSDVRFGEDDVDTEAAFLAKMLPLVGTYVVIRYSKSGIHLYTDPSAMLGVYHAPGFASSSPTLFPSFARDEEIDRQFKLCGSDDWYTGSLTPFKGLKALVANHVLDLVHQTVRRVWPLPADKRIGKKEGVEICSDLLRKAVLQFGKQGRAVISLTGGKDSRVNLAAVKRYKDEFEFFTLRSPNVKPCDIHIPERLAAEFSLNHRFIDIPVADAETQRLYDEICGGVALGARRDIVSACLKLEGKDTIHINGNLGAITKSFFWHSNNPTSVRVASLAKEFISRPPCIIEGIEEWLASLPSGLPATTVYNLMYLEQRGGRWMGPGENASALFYQSASPFNSRELFETVCSLPNHAQKGGTLLVDFVRCNWPELLEVPYCRNTRNLSTYLPKRVTGTIKSLMSRFKQSPP